MTSGLVFPRTATYGDVLAYLKPRMQARGWRGNRAVTYSPGPAADTQEQKLSPARIVFLEVGGGPGLLLEGTYDAVFIAMRAVGPQRNYDEAEKLALGVDASLVEMTSSGDLVPGLRALSIDRAGGRPQLLLRDRAERYHLTASYIVMVESGL